MRKLFALAATGLFLAAASFAASAAPVSQGEALKGAASETNMIQHVQHARRWSRRRHWRAGSRRAVHWRGVSRRAAHWRWGSRGRHWRWGSSGHRRYWSVRRHYRWGSRRGW